jgi:FkbM family methyltransferase
MNKFEHLTKSISCIPSIIVRLGAGTRSEYEPYKANNSSQVIYVEPDRHLVKAATDAFIDAPHVKVIPCAIATHNGPHTLNITNNRQFSSLLEPDELLEFYPNINVNEKSEVEAITLASLCNDLKINTEKDNLLIAELQGMEKLVFPTVDRETLQKFKWIIIRSSDYHLYGSASDKDTKSITATMQSAGFFVLTFEEDAPPFLNFLCIRNEALIDNAQLKTEYADLLETFEKLQLSLKTKLADLDRCLGMIQSYEEEREKTQALLHSYEEEKKISQNQIQSLERENDKSQSLIQSLEREKDKSQSLIQSLKLKKDKSKALIQSLEQEIEKQKVSLSELEQSNLEKSKEISDIQQTLRINNKLILRSDTDLRDLQLQYKSALQHQEQQHGLLCELKEKLHQASEFYQKLNLQNLVLDADLLEQSSSDNGGSGSKDQD